MGNKENKNRVVRIVLGVILVLVLFGFGGLIAIAGVNGLMEYGVRIYVALANHIWSSIAIPIGLLYFLLIGNVIALWLLWRRIYKKYYGKDEVWRQYRLDTFFWAEWQWDYTWNGKIANIWCECEKCAERMKPKVVPDGVDGHGVRFICNRCGKQSTTIRSVESEEEALERVEKKILRKIRVGKYRGEIEGKALEGDGN